MRSAIYGAALLAALIIAFRAGTWWAEPDPVVRTDTTFVERPAPPPIEPQAPETRIIYEERAPTELRDVTLRLPEELAEPRGVIGGAPIERRTPLFGQPEVRLRWFDPEAARWIEDVHPMPRPDWRLYLAGAGGIAAGQARASGVAGLGRRIGPGWLELEAGVAATTAGTGPTLTVRWRPVEWTF